MDDGEGVFAVVRDADGVALLAHQLGEDFLVDEVVLDDEDVDVGWGAGVL